MVRLTKDADKRRNPAANHPGYREAAGGLRGLTERQWFISLLVVSGLLLLVTFRGCILPTGVGPKVKPSGTPTPVATTTATTAPAGNQSEYTVVKGDTLSKIAQKTGISLDALLQANNLNRSSILSVGETLKIPK